MWGYFVGVVVLVLGGSVPRYAQIAGMCWAWVVGNYSRVSFSTVRVYGVSLVTCFSIRSWKAWCFLRGMSWSIPRISSVVSRLFVMMHCSHISGSGSRFLGADRVVMSVPDRRVKTRI